MELIKKTNKSILVIISEFGAKEYILPVLLDWLNKKKYNIEIVTNNNIKQSLIKKLSPFIKNNQIRFFDNNKILSILKLEKYLCILSSATKNFSEYYIISQAKLLKIPTVQFIDNIYGFKSRLTYKDKSIFPEFLIVINKSCVKYANNEGVPSNIIRICGHPAWDDINKVKIKNNKKTLFVGSPIKKFYGYSLGYSERDVWNICLKIKKSYPRLISSLNCLNHPNQKIPNYINKRYATTNNKNPELNKYGQVVGLFSSYLTESYLRGQKVVSIQANNIRDDKWIMSKSYKLNYAKNYKEACNLLLSSQIIDYNIIKDINCSKIKIQKLIDQIIK